MTFDGAGFYESPFSDNGPYAPCSVRPVVAYDGITKRTTGRVCGLRGADEWSDEVVAWVNAAWLDYQLSGNSICQHHLDMCPEV